MTETALIVGAGHGLSASIARLCHKAGMRVALAARDTDKLADLVAEVDGAAFSCDVARPDDVNRLFADTEATLGTPDFVVFNASGRTKGPVADLDPASILKAYEVGAFGGFLVAQQAATRMLRRGSGTIVFTGATASVKAMAGSIGFAMPKFALRALAQSLARELSPQNIHVAHVIVDGGIASSRRGQDASDPRDRWLDPDAIADTYLMLHRQHRSAWTWEIEVRPWVESF